MAGKQAQKTLKAENKPVLLAVLAGNIAIYWGAISATTLDMAGMQLLIKQGWMLLPTAFAGGLLVVLIGILPNDWKYRLIYWRWLNPLPGSRAFTDHAVSDPRVDIQLLKRKLGRLPTEPKEQNKTWYKLFKAMDTVPEIAEAHKESLLTRDWTALASIVFALSPTAVLFANVTIIGAGYVIATLCQYMTVRLAARNNGVRLVVNVLALVTARAA